MSVDKLTSTTGKVTLSQTGTGTTDGTGNLVLSIKATPNATATYGTHTLVSGTAYQPSTTKAVFAQCYVTHVGKVTWQIESSAGTIKETILTAATVIVHQSLVAALPAGGKVKLTLATSATVSKLVWNSF